MKVLFYITKNAIGGAERSLTNLANLFADHGNDVFYVVGYPKDNDYILSKEVNLIYLNKECRHNHHMTLTAAIKNGLRLRKVVSSFCPQILVTFLPHSLVSAHIAVLFTNTRLVSSVRCNFTSLYRNKLISCAYKVLLQLTDGIVFQTHEQEQKFKKTCTPKHAVISNFVSDMVFDQSIRQYERSGLIGVGRLIREKNWSHAIRAFALIADRVPDNFTVYGEGEEEGNLRELIAELKMDKRVFLEKHATDIFSKMCSSRAFILTSISEGMPNALIEAQALGLPCIATYFSGGACDEILDNGSNGLVVPQGVCEDLAEAIKEVLLNRELSELLSSNAIKKRALFSSAYAYVSWSAFLRDISDISE